MLAGDAMYHMQITLGLVLLLFGLLTFTSLSADVVFMSACWDWCFAESYRLVKP